MSQYAFHVDTDKCINCKACVMACKDKNNLKPGYKFRRVYTVTTGRWDQLTANGGAFSYSLSVACNHCEKPQCMVQCPSAAIVKRADGIVFIDRQMCTGCGTCFTACPYNVPSIDKVAEKASKCDFCRELVETGTAPVCAAACSMNALDAGEMDLLRAKYPDAVQQVYPLAEPTQTNPSLLITRHRKSTGAESDSNARVINLPEEIQMAEA